MTVPAALRDRHLRRYALRRHVVHVAGGSLSIVAPTSAHAVLAGDARLQQRCSRDREQPYWADVWPASVALARWIRRGPRLDGRTVLDLGCGIGVAGVAAGTHGAAHVVFADREADAAHFAGFNAAQHGIAHEARPFDWAREAPIDGVDVVLLADVTYSFRSHLSLLTHVASVVERGGVAWSTDPFREQSTEFLNRAAEAGLDVTEHRLSTGFGGERVDLRLAVLSSA